MINKASVTKIDKILREEIKQNVKNSLTRYISNFSSRSIHPLDLLIPKERRIRSIIGGLETSMGTTVWEPIAKTLAKSNNFEVVNEKILKPKPFPSTLKRVLANLITAREDSESWLSISSCKAKLKEVCNIIDKSKIETYVSPPAGTGVDILLNKNGKMFAFDIKTVQPNLGSIKSFNKQLLEWYAYSICKNPNIDLQCRIAYPYNPYADNFWGHSPHNRKLLQPGDDAFVENEFWDFLSGKNNTFQEIKAIFQELNNEGFGQELSSLIEGVSLNLSTG